MLDMSNNFHRTARTKFSPLLWIIAGCIIVLLPILIFWTSDNIKRQKRAIDRLLTEKGDAWIRGIEGWVRLGMMASGTWEYPVPRQFFNNQPDSQPPMQRLIIQNASLPDISYIILTDLDGNITNDNEPDKIGQKYAEDVDIPSLVESGELHKRELRLKDGTRVFEVYRVFLPQPRFNPSMPHSGPGAPLQKKRKHIQSKNPDYPEEESRIIFMGLDMTNIEEQSKEDTREVIKKGFYLLLIGFAGISLLILVQAYRTAQTSLTRIKALSDNIVDNMPIGLIVLDTESRIASFNYTAETLLHISGENIIGKSVEEKLPDQIIKLVNELRQNKRNIVKELELNLGEHGKIYLDINFSVLEDNSGTLMGYIILFRDLSEVQELKKEVERSTRLASIGRLAAGVAHEIRNPLSSIKGFATYFGERYKDIPEDKNTAQIMVSEVERLNRVVSQLLEFARPVNINKKTLDIKTIINHSAKMIERNAAKKDIEIRVDIPSGIPHVSIDSDRMNQVFLNLFLNSIEALDSGGKLSISVDYDTANELIKIKVSDTGKGIAPKDLGNVFDPYFTTKQSGTGLGLAIVHRIIESHNGEIKVESEQGKGTDVTITLPLD